MKIQQELRDWIINMSRSGHDIQTLMDMMQQSGYGGRQSRRILASVLNRPGLAVEVELAPKGRPEAVKRADGCLRPTHPDGPTMEIDGRRITVSTSLESPQLRVLHNVLDDDECDALIDAARPRLERALTVAKDGSQQVDTSRTSSAMFFNIGETPLVQAIDRRLSQLVNMPINHGEALQVLHYDPGQQYEPHHDWFDPNKPGYAQVAQGGGQRVATVLMYLNDPEKGGGTYFPRPGLTVSAHRGDAVYFAYEGGDPESLHAGLPVVRGEKWLATRWLREKPYYKS